MNLAAVEDMEARFPDTDVVLIESGGDNLTLTFSPALVDFFVYVIDVAAGDKIPRKNGPGISQSDILVINKTDLAPYVGASLEVMEHDSTLDAQRQAVRVHQLPDRRGHPRAHAAAGARHPVRPAVRAPIASRPWRSRGRPRPGAPGSSPRTRTSRARCAAPWWARSGALRLGFERRGARTALVTMERQVPLLVQRPLYWDRCAAGHGLCVHHPHLGQRPRRRPLPRAHRRRARRPGACHDTGRDQDPRDGCELRGPGPGDHGRRSRRVPGVPARADHPASSFAIRLGHADDAARGRDDAAVGDRDARPHAPRATASGSRTTCSRRP